MYWARLSRVNKPACTTWDDQVDQQFQREEVKVYNFNFTPPAGPFLQIRQFLSTAQILSYTLLISARGFTATNWFRETLFAYASKTSYWSKPIDPLHWCLYFYISPVNLWQVVFNRRLSWSPSYPYAIWHGFLRTWTLLWRKTPIWSLFLKTLLQPDIVTTPGYLRWLLSLLPRTYFTTRLPGLNFASMYRCLIWRIPSTRSLLKNGCTTMGNFYMLATKRLASTDKLHRVYWLTLHIV